MLARHSIAPMHIKRRVKHRSINRNISYRQVRQNASTSHIYRFPLDWRTTGVNHSVDYLFKKKDIYRNQRHRLYILYTYKWGSCIIRQDKIRPNFVAVRRMYISHAKRQSDIFSYDVRSRPTCPNRFSYECVCSRNTPHRHGLCPTDKDVRGWRIFYKDGHREA